MNALKVLPINQNILYALQFLSHNIENYVTALDISTDFVHSSPLIL